MRRRYFLVCGSALAFICVSSLPSFSMVALSVAISARGGEIAGGSGDLRIGFAIELAQLLLKEFDVGLQACGAAIHLPLGRADFEPANVLRHGTLKRRHQQRRCERVRAECARP